MIKHFVSLHPSIQKLSFFFQQIMCVPPTLVSMEEPVRRIITHWVLNAAAVQGILDLIVAFKEVTELS